MEWVRFQKSNRLAYENYLRVNYEMLTGEVAVKSYPYYMSIDPSSICQLACPICPTGVENEARRNGRSLHLRNRAFMSIEMFDSLLDEIGDYLFYVLLYNWGEPLLNSNLPEMIRKAKKYDIYTEIHTNLSMRLTDAQIETILTSGIDDIAASIDGFSPETYSTYRRGGDFELVKSNIRRLAAARDRLDLKTNIIWNFLVFSFNEHEIKAIRRYCKDIGVIFNQREPLIDKKNFPDWLPSHRKHELEYSGITEQANRCSWHYAISVVNADGSVSPCCAPWDEKFDFGKVMPRSMRFADVWNNKMYRKSRATFAGKSIYGIVDVETICDKCPFGKFIQNLYMFLDHKVVTRFWEIFNGKDPALELAFERLGDEKLFIDYYRNRLLEN